MKKGGQYEGIIEKIEFPNKGIMWIEEEIQEQGQNRAGQDNRKARDGQEAEEAAEAVQESAPAVQEDQSEQNDQESKICRKREKVIIKNAVPGQKVRVVITKKRKGKNEGLVLEVLEKSPLETAEDPCSHFGTCGGCLYQTIPYGEQLKIKEEQVKTLLGTVLQEGTYEFQGIKPSPLACGYRNKMEFSFGDEYKDGPLSLGMHKRGSFYDVVTADGCKIVHADFSLVLELQRNTLRRWE